jgi:hypothetical protein
MAKSLEVVGSRKTRVRASQLPAGLQSRSMTRLRPALGGTCASCHPPWTPTDTGRQSATRMASRPVPVRMCSLHQHGSRGIPRSGLRMLTWSQGSSVTRRPGGSTRDGGDHASSAPGASAYVAPWRLVGADQAMSDKTDE